MTNTTSYKTKNAPMFKSYPDVLTVKDLQLALGIGRMAAYDLLEKNAISSFRIGRIYKIPKTSLIQYIQKFDVESC